MKQMCPDLILVQVPTLHGKANLEIYREASANILATLSKRYSSIVIERASIDEVYLDITIEAGKLLNSEDAVNFIERYMDSVKVAPTLIAGDDGVEMKMTKADIRNGHSGQVIISEDHHQIENDHIDEATEPARYYAEMSWLDRPAGLWTTEDRLLLAGAVIMDQLRKDVLNQLGFTCSAGIACNKMLAKLASGMHKPNKQTLVPQSVIPKLMSELPFSRVQGFGGKLGAEITESFGEGVTTMGDLLVIPRETFVQRFGHETATWIHQRAQGLDSDPVQDRSLPISIGCSKSFRSTNMLSPLHLLDGTVLKWLTELSKELMSRVNADTERHQRKPTQLHVGVSVLLGTKGMESKLKASKVNGSAAGGDKVAEWWAEQGISLSKTIRLPSGGAEVVGKASLAQIQKAISENAKIQSHLLSCADCTFSMTYLSLSANQFDNIFSGKRSIFSYLQPAFVAPSSSNTLKQSEFIENGDSNITIADKAENCDAKEDFIFLDDSNAVRETSNIAADSTANTESDILNEKHEESHFATVNNLPFESNDWPSLVKESWKPAAALSSSARISNVTKSTVIPPSNMKYLVENGIDLDSFLVLPHTLQQEILSDCMFQKFQGSLNCPKENSGGHNKTKLSLSSSSQSAKRKSELNSSSSNNNKKMNISSWLQTKKID